MPAPLPRWLEIAASTGEAVSGVAAIAAVVTAWVQLRRWNREKWHERSSDAAAAAIVAVATSCGSVGGWILGVHQMAVVREGDDVSSSAKVAYELFPKMLAALNGMPREIQRALTACEVHLDDEDIAPLRRLLALAVGLPSEVEPLGWRLSVAEAAVLPHVLAEVRTKLAEVLTRMNAGEAAVRARLVPIARFHRRQRRLEKAWRSLLARAREMWEHAGD